LVGVKIRSIVFGAEFLLYLKQIFRSVPSSGGSFRFVFRFVFGAEFSSVLVQLSFFFQAGCHNRAD
jgi:hypothetical protein